MGSSPSHFKKYRALFTGDSSFYRTSKKTREWLGVLQERQQHMSYRDSFFSIPFDLIRQMLSKSPAGRPTAHKVLLGFPKCTCSCHPKTPNTNHSCSGYRVSGVPSQDRAFDINPILDSTELPSSTLRWPRDHNMNATSTAGKKKSSLEDSEHNKPVANRAQRTTPQRTAPTLDSTDTSLPTPNHHTTGSSGLYVKQVPHLLKSAPTFPIPPDFLNRSA